MRKLIAAFFVASLLAVVAVPLAQAAPVEVDLRIEGEAETLFEGPVLSDVHKVRNLANPEWRRCNGINVNAPWNPVPGVVPTSASFDAMRIVNEPFDGVWYQQYEDFFVTQFGPDRQDVASSEYWGVLVNNVYTSVGGCQYQLDGDDEVLWAYDAFDGRSRLVLYPAEYTGGALPPTATAALGEPFGVEVYSWSGYVEGAPPETPQRGTQPFEGAEVGPVLTDAKGFQRVDTASADTVVTDADGAASITFEEPGWHRIKATRIVAGTETVIRSNRIDVCVPQPPATGCGSLPADAQARVPPPPLPGEAENAPAEPEPDGPVPGGGLPIGGGPPPVAGRVSVALKPLDRRLVARGMIRARWEVLDPGPGISRWTIAARALGRAGARFVNRASGTAATTARVRLPRGAAYMLRIVFTDLLGRSSSARLGTVRIPG
jgi:uncharacterized protein DUF4430